ncbi:unnamed protein product [Closterium sp. Naga37s-1]|nr:unnamed protein product [Closterium sp. Naga37s-1]
MAARLAPRRTATWAGRASPVRSGRDGSLNAAHEPSPTRSFGQSPPSPHLLCSTAQAAEPPPLFPYREGEGMPDLSKMLRHSDLASAAASGDAGGDAAGGKLGAGVEGESGGDKEGGDEGGKDDPMDHDGPAAADGAGAASAPAATATDVAAAASGPLPGAPTAAAAGAAAAGAYQQQPAVEISVPPESITTANRQVRSRQLWGTDVYTDDSDIVAVLMHVGYITPVSVPPPASIAELRATIRVLPPQPSYRSSSRNSMRSRAWGSGKGTCSYAVESCRIIKLDGTSIDLEASSARTPPVGPTLVPAAVERTMTTRASASVRNAHRHQRFVQEVTLQYNLCNEPWLKYSMAIIADHGLKRPQFTSARLKRAEVLYLETATHRFELSYEPVSARKVFYSVALSQAQQQQQQQHMQLEAAGAKADADAAAAGDGGAAASAAAADAGAAGVVREGGVDAGGEKEKQGTTSANPETQWVLPQSALAHVHGKGKGPRDTYRWTQCVPPLPLDQLRSHGCPLPVAFTKILESGLAWDEVQWAPGGVWVRGLHYPVVRAHFMPRKSFSSR